MIDDAATIYVVFRGVRRPPNFPMSSISPITRSTSSAFTSLNSACTSSVLITSSSSSLTAVFFLTFVFFATTAEGQRPLSASLHSPHFLPTGRQIVCPKPTRRLLMSCHLSLGNHDSSAARVCSGCALFCHPHRFVIRWTCTSTPIPSSRPQAALIVRYAIFGPTPGSETNPSMLSGISEFHLSRRISAVCLMYFVLRLWKPTLLMKPLRVGGSRARTDSRLKPCNH